MKLLISLSAMYEQPLRKDIYEIAALFAVRIPLVLFGPQYRKEIVGYLANSIQRGKEEIQRQKLLGSSVLLTLSYREPKNVVLRGDYRYDSTALTQYLINHPDKELLPILVGKTAAGEHLLDGHHRWRAYLEAKRKPLCLTIEVASTKIVPSVYFKTSL